MAAVESGSTAKTFSRSPQGVTLSADPFTVVAILAGLAGIAIFILILVVRHKSAQVNTARDERDDATIRAQVAEARNDLREKTPDEKAAEFANRAGRNDSILRPIKGGRTD